MTPDLKPESSAFAKARLITESLATLRAAQSVDERDDLDPAHWEAWYDATMPDVKSIKDLAAEMWIEMRRRRGERVVAEGERRGGDIKSTDAEIKVTPRVTLISGERKQRSEDRLLAEHPDVVEAYKETTKRAGRRVSAKGAITAVRKAKRLEKATVPKLPVEPVRQCASYVENVRAEVRGRIEQVRDQAYTVEELAQKWDVHITIARRYVREAILLGDVIKDGERYTISPTLWFEAFIKRLHAEIVRRRKECRDGYHAWRPDNVHTVKQSALLDWIEDEVSKLPLAHSGARDKPLH